MPDDLPEWALREAEAIRRRHSDNPQSGPVQLRNDIARALVTQRGIGREEMRGRAASLLEDHAKGKISHISFGPEAGFDPEGCTEIAAQLVSAMTAARAENIRALPLDEEPSE